MQNLEKTLTQVRKSIQAAVDEAHRNASEISLLAVSKRKSAELIAAAAGLGQQDFGENYANELEEKAQALSHLDLNWHFIGPIQSNKTGIIAEHCSWVHSIDREKIARRLSAQRRGKPLNVLIQVNIDGSSTKAGCPPGDVKALTDCIEKLPNLALKGLMCIPDRESGSRVFQALKGLRDDLQQSSRSALTELSMGMSQDMDEAIKYGSTWVRVGTAIFGERS